MLEVGKLHIHTRAEFISYLEPDKLAPIELIRFLQ